MDIKNSIVAILNSRGKIVGTGFLASQNLVVTCAHVVVAAGAIDGDTVQVRFHGQSEKLDALVVSEYWRDVDQGDVAILRLENVPESITPLPLGNATGSAGHDFYAYGYATVTAVQGIGARGKFVDIVDNGRLVQLTSQEPDHGMSGGPVWDEQRRVVIGMVTKGKGLVGEDKSIRNVFTTFATAVEVIRESCPTLQLTEICPYRSLDVFNEEDAPFFFGREKVIQKMLDSLKREPRFLAVLGPSGSGKSSVVRAGLIPALRQGKVPGSQKWEIVTLRPANDPFEQLATAGFINLKAGLESSVKTWLADRPDKTRLMLFIDQFEEVLVSTPKDVRQKFIVELSQLLNAPAAITLVLSLRDDFYSRFLHDAATLAGWLERGLVNTPPVLEQDDLRAMIVEPAKAIGLTFDEGLVDVIIADACETDRSKGLARSTILPLLEFALTQLWESRKDGRLTHYAYKNIGGTTGSLSQWADHIYYELNPSERKLAEDVFCKLVHLGDEKEHIPDTRRIIPIRELEKGQKKVIIEQIVEKLIQTRLLSVHREFEKGERFVEIIHDALLYEWILLKKWIDHFRQIEQKLRKRRRLLILTGLLLSFALFIVLGTVIVRQQTAVTSAENDRSTAQAKQATALSVANNRLLTTKALSLYNQDDNGPILSSLLAIESERIKQSLEAEQIIRDSLSLLPIIVYNEKIDSSLEKLVFSDNEYWLAGLKENGDIWILDLSLNRVVNYSGEFKNIADIKFFPKSTLLIFGSQDGNIIVLDVANEKARLFQLGGNFLTSVGGSPDGTKLVSGYKDGTVIITDINSGREIRRLRIDREVSQVNFNDDGTEIFIADDHLAVHIISMASFSEDTKVDLGFNELAFSRNSDWVIYSSRYSLTRVNVKTGERKDWASSNFYLTPSAVEISSDGNRIVAGSNGIVKMWDAQSNKQIALMEHQALITSLALGIDGNLAASASEDGYIRVWRLGDSSVQKIENNIPSAGGVTCVAFSSDSTYLAVGTITGIISIYNLDSKDMIAQFDGNDLIYSLSFSPDGKLIASGSRDKSARVWDIAQNQELVQVPHYTWVNSVSFSPDGKYIVSSDENAAVAVWNAHSGEIILEFIERGVNKVIFSPDGKLMVTANDGGKIKIYDSFSEKVIRELTAEGGVNIVAFNHSGDLMLSGGLDRKITVWGVANWKKKLIINPDQIVMSAIFTSDGKNIVSGGIDIGGGVESKIQVWDTGTGEELLNIENRDTISSLDISPDGRYIASGFDHSDKAFLWTWKSRDLIEELCGRLTRNLTRQEWAEFVGSDLPYHATCPNLPVFPEFIPTSTP